LTTTLLLLASASGCSSEDGNGGTAPEPLDCDNKSHCLELTPQACEETSTLGSTAPMTVTNTCEFPVWCRLSYWVAVDGSSKSGTQGLSVDAKETQGTEGLMCDSMELGKFYFAAYCRKTDETDPKRYSACEVPKDADLPALELVREHCSGGQTSSVGPSPERGTCSLHLGECAKPNAASRDLEIECAPNPDFGTFPHHSHVCTCYEGGVKLKTFEQGVSPSGDLEDAYPVCDGPDVDRRLRRMLAGQCGLLTYSHDEDGNMVF